SPSGLWRRTGNAVRGNPSRVRIPPSPPSTHGALGDGAGSVATPMSSRAFPEIIPLDVGTFTFAADEPWAGEQGVVVAYAIRRREGILLFDTGFGFRNAYLDDRYHPTPRRLDDVLGEAGIRLADVDLVANCHLHPDH